MQNLIGPVSKCVVIFFFTLVLVEAQYSQDFRTTNSYGYVRFPGGRPRPRTELVQAHKSKIRLLPESNPEPSTDSLDPATQNAAVNVAQFALTNQNGGQDQLGKLRHQQTAGQTQPTQFVSRVPPKVNPAVFQNDIFDYSDSQRVRLSPELQEQRDIADYQEFLLLQGTSALFLERPKQATSAQLQSQTTPQEALRSLPPLQPQHSNTLAPQPPYPATSYSQASFPPHPYSAYPQSPYQPDPYTHGSSYSYSGNSFYPYDNYQDTSSYSFGYDVYHG